MNNTVICSKLTSLTSSRWISADGHDQACMSCNISHRPGETLFAAASPGWMNEPQQSLHAKQQPPSYFPPGVHQDQGSRRMRRRVEYRAGEHCSVTEICTRSISFPQINCGVICYRAYSPAGAYYCPVSPFSRLQKGSKAHKHLSWHPNWKFEMFFTANTFTLIPVLTPAMQRSRLS